MSKPVVSIDVLNWIADQMWLAAGAVAGGFVIFLGYLGKNFWLARFIEPQEAMRQEQTEMKAELSELRKKQEDQDKEISEIRVTLASQTAILQNIQGSNSMILEILIKDKQGKR